MGKAGVELVEGRRSEKIEELEQVANLVRRETPASGCMSKGPGELLQHRPVDPGKGPGPFDNWSRVTPPSFCDKIILRVIMQ